MAAKSLRILLSLLPPAVLMLPKNRTGGLAAFLLMTFLSGFVIIFMNGTSFPYYTFVFGCFSVLGLMWLSEIPQTGESMLSLSLKISFFACAAGILCFSENMYLLAYEKKDFPQFRAAEVSGDFQKNGNSSQFFLYQRVGEADHRD